MEESTTLLKLRKRQQRFLHSHLQRYAKLNADKAFIKETNSSSMNGQLGKSTLTSSNSLSKLSSISLPPLRSQNSSHVTKGSGNDWLNLSGSFASGNNPHWATRGREGRVLPFTTKPNQIFIILAALRRSM